MRKFGIFIIVLAAFVNTVWADQVYTKEKLYKFGTAREFTGNDLATIAFPIGGLATGNITLGGRGEIRELEIFNRPAKGKHPDLTFFSIWVKVDEEKPVAKILERKLLPPYEAWMGIPRTQLPGVARFGEAVFKGEYPFAYLRLIDDDIPLKITLEAYNPFIPLDPERSGLPAAIFNWTIKNERNAFVRCSIALSAMNPIQTLGENGQRSFGNNLNEYSDASLFRGIKMSSGRATPEALDYGDLSIVTTEKDVDVQTRWYRGGWWDNAHVFWDDFADDGRISNVRDSQESPQSRSDTATLLVSITLDPGEERTIPFYLTWYFPNRENYWNREEKVKGKKFKNHYAIQFKNSWDVARYLVENLEGIYRDTKKFHDILFASTYPSYVIDALSSQTSSLKTNLILRTEDGKLFGFEGLSDDRGCCPMNCTHVWNYEQTLAFLFPSLERTMRETDFLHNTFPNGYQVFRTLMPLTDQWWAFKPCADGQMGNVVRVYREWKMSGDTAWLKKLWPTVKAALEFAWRGVGEVNDSLAWQKEQLLLPWDSNKDGVMEGEQHNTYDIEFYGPNTMEGSLYLAALKAAARMADALGEKAKADEYEEIFRKGSQQYDTQLWNGEYYIQKVKVMDGLTVPEHLRSPVKKCENPKCKGRASPGGKMAALSEDAPYPKYQYGDGCLSDQLLGQYLAHVIGLGYIFDPAHVDKAMASIFSNNFKRNLSNFSNVQRVYALNDEAGLLLCSWPRGNRPALPFVYSDEVWTGIEYQVAAALIYSGHIDEGLTIVKAVRDRHSGFNRNPWNEFECGHHYARAMASWAVMLALCGYHYDGVDHSMAFAPQIRRDDFYTFWSTGSGWGSLAVQGDHVTLKVEFGRLKLESLGFSSDYGWSSIQDARLNSSSLATALETDGKLAKVLFVNPVEIKRGDAISIIFRD